MEVLEQMEQASRGGHAVPQGGLDKLEFIEKMKQASRVDIPGRVDNHGVLGAGEVDGVGEGAGEHLHVHTEAGSGGMCGEENTGVQGGAG